MIQSYTFQTWGLNYRITIILLLHENSSIPIIIITIYSKVLGTNKSGWIQLSFIVVKDLFQETILHPINNN